MNKRKSGFSVKGSGVQKSCVKLRRVPKNYGVQRLIKNRTVTIESINALTKEVGAFIKPVEYAHRGKRGELMRQVIGRNRAKDTGQDVARKKSIFVKGLPTAELVDGKLVKSKILLPHSGCHPASLALYEALKALQKKTRVKLNPKIARGYSSSNSRQPTSGQNGGFNSTVIFELNGKFWEADPFHARIGANIKEITQEDAHNRRYVPPNPISFDATKLEAFSQNAVKKLLENNNSQD
jgi:hypothetical protein